MRSPRPCMCPKGASRPARRLLRRVRRAAGASCGASIPTCATSRPNGASGYLVEQIREIVADTALAPIQARQEGLHPRSRGPAGRAAPPTRSSRRWRSRPTDVVLILLGAHARDACCPPSCRAARWCPSAHIPASRGRGHRGPEHRAPIARPGAPWPSRPAAAPSRAAVEFLAGAGSERLAFRTPRCSDLARLSARPTTGTWSEMRPRRSWWLSKAPLDVVRAAQEAELAENADFLGEIGHPPDRGAQQAPAVGARPPSICARLTAMVRSWLRDVAGGVRCGTPELVINVDVRDSSGGGCVSRRRGARRRRACRAVRRCDEAISYNVSPETCIGRDAVRR